MHSQHGNIARTMIPYIFDLIDDDDDVAPIALGPYLVILTAVAKYMKPICNDDNNGNNNNKNDNNNNSSSSSSSISMHNTCTVEF